METGTVAKDLIKIKAKQLKKLDDAITLLNGQLQEIKSDREKISDDLVQELQGVLSIEDGEGIRMDDIGFIKLVSDNYPRVVDFDGLQHWAEENKQPLPQATINTKTLGAWLREQLGNSKPVPPEEVVKSFIKTRVKVLK